ncbi:MULTISPECIES: HpcH/HpaI aldolase/citrate lyase family protein [Methylobacterium]|uniref:CoA ester lyase n=1 Tax=Methylobacterium longum TaxID=767694 RepID=A0ABT8AKF0_9HYPH|nr:MULTISPECIES: CoA ester lyase [Methylobacterium]MCJ2098533.1 CoA ester lyase [Methylobacterium sp. E-046]MDN3570339.1 CoA ester lyase [Methylobacterium longum]GJE11336.1 (3S)-malyl-CoA thioesterase [Methylobacterium longum]
MSEIRPRRSVLAMPGSNARALVKAQTLPADVILIDLEDGTAPDAKAAARAQVAAAVAARGFGHREVVVRINPPETEDGEADLAALARAGADAILVPKVRTSDTLIAVGSRLRRLGAPSDTRVWAMIETPLAVVNAAEIAGAARDVDGRLSALVIGPNDLLKAARIRPPGRSALVPWLMTVLAAARAYEIDAIDGVFTDLRDAAGFEAECAQGRDLGFDGKMLIHPSQIDPANAAFAPDAEEIAQARRMLDVFDAPENRARGVVAVDGKMVERLHVEVSRRTLAMAEAIARLGA